jgi:Fic family protein
LEIDNLLVRIDALKQTIDRRRPLSPMEARELREYFRVDLTYSSNALEGNSLTLSETKVLLEDGLTVGGKPIRDSYEAVGHADAYDFMLTAAQSQNLTVTQTLILELHRLFYARVDGDKAGRYRDHRVFISGTTYLPPAPRDLPALMERFIDEVAIRAEALHPVLLAAFAHRRLVDIHPFSDGNGRTARLLMNLILLNRGYFIVSIPPVLRHDYIEALRTAQRNTDPTDEPFNRLIAECEIETEKDYARLLQIPLDQA